MNLPKFILALCTSTKGTRACSLASQPDAIFGGLSFQKVNSKATEA